MLSLNCKGRLLTVDSPLLMGIINITPDSFYKGSRIAGTDNILTLAEKMLKDGADILDLGGQSTRPGSKQIGEDEELKRVIDGIVAIRNKLPEAIISIDTFFSKVAYEAVKAGADIVNDISAGTMDKNMISTVASLQVPYVLMHMKGIPGTMQTNTGYQNMIAEILDFMIRKRAELHENGIYDIIIDPGFGFGKTIAHNFELLRSLPVFRMLDCPIMIGLSRKSTIYKTLGVTSDEALNGTTVLHTLSLINGANILRVHDVKQAHEAIKLISAYGK